MQIKGTMTVRPGEPPEGPRPRVVEENPFGLRDIGTDAKSKGQRPNAPGNQRFEWEEPRLEGLPPVKVGSSSISPDQPRDEALYTLGTFCILIGTLLSIAGY